MKSPLEQKILMNIQLGVMSFDKFSQTWSHILLIYAFIMLCSKAEAFSIHSVLILLSTIQRRKPSVCLSALFRHALYSVVSTRIDTKFARNKAPIFGDHALHFKRFYSLLFAVYVTLNARVLTIS